jgi:hypothetical protein
MCGQSIYVLSQKCYRLYLDREKVMKGRYWAYICSLTHPLLVFLVVIFTIGKAYLSQGALWGSDFSLALRAGKGALQIKKG